MDSKISSLLDEASARLNARARGMNEAEFSENWHAIDRARFYAEDPETFAERRIEEMMLGNWDTENGHAG